MSMVLLSVGFVVAGLIVGLFVTSTAPVGYEDETGFHFGKENSGTVPAHPRPSLSDVAAARQFSPKPA